MQSSKTRDIFGHCPVVFIQPLFAKAIGEFDDCRSKNYDQDATDGYYYVEYST